MVEILELCDLVLVLVKNTLRKQKEKIQKELILYTSIAKTKKLCICILQIEIAIEEMYKRNKNMQKTFYQILNAIKRLS